MIILEKWLLGSTQEHQVGNDVYWLINDNTFKLIILWSHQMMHAEIDHFQNSEWLTNPTIIRASKCTTVKNKATPSQITTPNLDHTSSCKGLWGEGRESWQAEWCPFSDRTLALNENYKSLLDLLQGVVAYPVPLPVHTDPARSTQGLCVAIVRFHYFATGRSIKACGEWGYTGWHSNVLGTSMVEPQAHGLFNCCSDSRGTT